MKCPKCNGNMKEGYVTSRIDVWEGKIDKHPDTQRNLGPIVAYTCEKCGYIEFYGKEQE